MNCADSSATSHFLLTSLTTSSTRSSTSTRTPGLLLPTFILHTPLLASVHKHQPPKTSLSRALPAASEASLPPELLGTYHDLANSRSHSPEANPQPASSANPQECSTLNSAASQPSPSTTREKITSIAALCGPLLPLSADLSNTPENAMTLTPVTMPPLTNVPVDPAAASDSDHDISPRSFTPPPKIRAEDIELPPSPQDEEHEIPPSSPLPSPPSATFGSLNRTNSYFPQVVTPLRPRAASPPRRMRPLSSGGMASVPLMQRAHSSPGVDSSGRYMNPYGIPRRPSSPLHSGRRRSPLRSAMEDAYPGVPSWSGLSIEPNIPEHEELDFSTDMDLPQPSPNSSFSNTFPRARRRTVIPLHQSASAPSLYARAMSPGMSGRTSPLPSFSPQKYTYEPYPMYSFSSASSMPSTPTSLRSRSPSISSLETIEDIPDAEEAAMLAAEEAKLRGEDGDASDLPRRSSFESRGSHLKSNKERKRWSVCGAERRADFSLEPIEE